MRDFFNTCVTNIKAGTIWAFRKVAYGYGIVFGGFGQDSFRQLDDAGETRWGMSIALALPRAAVRIIGWVLSPAITAVLWVGAFVLGSIKVLPGISFMYGSGAFGEVIDLVKDTVATYTTEPTFEASPAL
jgi:hypothetical protein